ncbi:MAG: hypothetical protein SF053_17675 [Bacteroidia bacterium]|nr:hypothetical protein [Bacteroidia bacterium]
MLKPEQIERIHFQLESGGITLLSVMVARSGAITRMGDGTGVPETLVPCIGRTEENLFAPLVSGVTPELLEMAGRYEMPDPQGDIHVLTITLEGEEAETGFAFTYGIDSDGPPEEMVEWVTRALELTDPWYTSQLARRNRKR